MAGGFYFATCNTSSAFRFLQQMYPKKALRSESFPKLMDLIKRDIVRVEDPNFHQPCQIIGGDNYKEEYKQEIDAAIAEFKTAIADAPEKEDPDNA